MKKNRNKNGMLTLCVFPIITPRSSLQSYTMHAGRGGVIYREYTECCIPFLCLFFFYQLSLYPINKMFYLLVCILFSAPYARAISMSELNEREARSMIAHARDECARHVLTSFIVGTI